MNVPENVVALASILEVGLDLNRMDGKEGHTSVKATVWFISVMTILWQFRQDIAWNTDSSCLKPSAGYLPQMKSSTTRTPMH